MAIRYVHNDPASVPYLESPDLAPRAPPTGARARFDVALPPEAVYAAGTPEYVDRQCYEAALRTLDTWERVAAPLRLWHSGQRLIRLEPRRETGIGASYERRSIGFDYHPFGDPLLFTGASTDAVSHEIGHAILDAIRPEFWDSLYAEVAAFHEGFADCISLLVALTDERYLEALFAGPGTAIDLLSAPNATAQVAESVAHYYRGLHGAQHAQSVPRRLRNDFQWAIPGTLPANPTATTLAREPHSFGQVFAGCFYDCVNNIYRAGGVHTADGLRDAALTAGRALAAAVEAAPEEVRFFRSVGRAMIHADPAGAHHVQIRDAFNAHNVQLGSSNLLAPTAGLGGPAPATRGPNSHRLDARTRRDLVRQAGAGDGSTVSAGVVRIGASQVVRARLQQPMDVSLQSADGKPIDVRARTAQDVLLGGQRGHCVVLGDLPNQPVAEQEVNEFVDTLAGDESLHESARDRSGTHRIRKRGNRHVLQRVRFSCC